jgi:uncharacterized membrane protein YeiH
VFGLTASCSAGQKIASIVLFDVTQNLSPAKGDFLTSGKKEPSTQNAPGKKKEDKRSDSEKKNNSNNRMLSTLRKTFMTKTSLTQTFLKGCSYGGIGFATLMGAYQGKQAGMSPLGCTVMGFINGMGGGTMRDMFQGKRVYWLEKPIFAWWCFGMGLVGANLWDPIKRRFGVSEKDRWAQIISLCSLGGCTCSGAEAALKQGSGGALGQPIKGAIYAMLCATGGGVVMAHMLNKKPLTLHAEGWQNVFPAAVGAVAYQAAHALGLPYNAVVATGFTRGQRQ